ncbi:MAG: HAD family hydrolase [Planctomycetes bacterium]|nr:HAD family hydrolase [Planctomycetota bacterium]
MVTTVIFDLDDTLYDEIEYCKSGFAAVAEFLANSSEFTSTNPTTVQAEMGHIAEALWEQFSTGNHTKTFNAALDKLKISYDDKLILELIKVFRQHKPTITLPTDSRDALCKLNKKYTLALLTDGFLPGQQLKVHALGIEQYFKSIIYTEQLGRECWKPSPVGFENIIQALEARPENTVYIADNEKKDFIAPNKLGFISIQILRPARLHTSVCKEPEGRAHHIIGQISQLLSLLEKL